MIQIVNGQILRFEIPKMGTLNDGTMVEEYDKLSAEVLKTEGWLPLYDVEPSYNNNTHHIVPYYTLEAQRVVKNYSIVENPKSKIEVMEEAVRKLLILSDISPEVLLEFKILYPRWETTIDHKIIKGDVYLYNGELYKVELDHVTLSHYTPDIIQALMTKIIPPGIIGPWEQRYGHNPYIVGDKVIWEGSVYRCTSSTTYSPTDVPSAWVKEA